MWPLWNTKTSSPSDIASSWSWVTKIMVAPSWRWSSFNSLRMAIRSLASRLLSGSSMSITRDGRTMLRASATRCCWPPESSVAIRSPKSASPTSASAWSIARAELCDGPSCGRAAAALRSPAPSCAARWRRTEHHRQLARRAGVKCPAPSRRRRFQRLRSAPDRGSQVRLCIGALFCLPQPLAPSSTEIAPGRNVAESESMTVAAPKRLLTRSRVTVIVRQLLADAGGFLPKFDQCISDPPALCGNR